MISAMASQPERYRASVAALGAAGRKARSVLFAPALYLGATRHGAEFDHQVSYEALRGVLNGYDLALLEAAIAQAATPYDPVPNASSGAFHADLKRFAGVHFPELVIKQNPNGNGVRPGGSNTIYFDVPRTLAARPNLPRPRMSLQCRDLGAGAASVKIMLPGLGARAQDVELPQCLAEIGAYLRPAGRSLGIVIDTPRLDTQLPLDGQAAQAEMAMQAARALAAWWNSHAATFNL